MNDYKLHAARSNSSKEELSHYSRSQSFNILLGLLVYAPIVFFLLFVLYYIAFANVDSVIRYNKYTIYFSIDRFLFTGMILLFSCYVIVKTSNGLWGMIYPTNLFMLLFLFLVLPGVLLTSNFTIVGLKSFYTYLVSFLLFMFGLLGAYFMESKRKAENGTILQKSVAHAPKVIYSAKSLIYMLMMGLYLLGLLVSFFKIDISTSIYSELLSFFSDGHTSRTLADVRQRAASRNFLDVFYSYSVVLFMPISSTFVFINGIIRKHKGQILTGLVMLIIVLFFLISGGARLKGLSFLLLVFVAYSYTNGIRIKHVINISSLVLWLLIFQTIALGRMSAASEGHGLINVIMMSFNRVVERVFLTKGYCTQQVFHYIPGYTDFKWGETFWVTLQGSSTEKVTFAQEMFDFIYRSGHQGTAGPQAFGEAYANVDVAGTLIIAFLLGLLVQKSTEFVKRHLALDAFMIAFLAYFTVLISRVGYSGVLTFKANGLHVLILLYLCFVVLKKVMRQ